jgi:hypothetical protein
VTTHALLEHGADLTSRGLYAQVKKLLPWRDIPLRNRVRSMPTTAPKPAGSKPPR